MSETRFQPKPLHGIIGVVAVLLFVVVRFATLGESDDPKLFEAIRAELVNELGGRIGQEIKNLDTRDAVAVAAFTQRADPESIELHSVRVSKPLLSISSSGKAIVRIEYSLSGSARETAYWRFEYSTIAGWRHPRSTMAVLYYLNFV